MKPARLLLTLALVFLALPVRADRLALVIGNDGYASAPKLRNARVDAEAMAKSLEGSGFRVTRLLDAERKPMFDGIQRFVETVRPSDEVVVFYGGHAVELGGTNYLLPTDIRTDDDQSVQYDAVPLTHLLQKVAQQQPKFSLVIVDACRDNPFAGRMRNLQTRGLIPTGARGQIVIYSASAGQKAVDGLFTQVMVREIEKGGLVVQDLMRRVKSEVKRRAVSLNHEQQPAVYDESDGDYNFYFRGAPKAASSSPNSGSQDRCDADDVLWGEAKRLDTTEGYEAYLETCGKGRYAAMARAAKKKLEAGAKPPVPAAASPAADPYPAGKEFRDDCAGCPAMVVIPGGHYEMGSPAGEAGRSEAEGPVHRVTVKKFALGKHEVTRGEFRRFTKETGQSLGGCKSWDDKEERFTDTTNTWENPGYEQTDDHPVVCASWEDAQGYVKWLSRKSGQAYRLASEAEWEYAARGGTKTSRYWGDGEADACRYANVADRAAKRTFNWSMTFDCDDGYARTSPVGNYRENGYGLKDMLGNVWEWVEDCWNEYYVGAPEDGSAWSTGQCSQRVMRGGGWYGWPNGTRSAYHGRNNIVFRSGFLGFRVARTLP